MGNRYSVALQNNRTGLSWTSLDISLLFYSCSFASPSFHSSTSAGYHWVWNIYLFLYICYDNDLSSYFSQVYESYLPCIYYVCLLELARRFARSEALALEHGRITGFATGWTVMEAFLFVLLLCRLWGKEIWKVQREWDGPSVSCLGDLRAVIIS